MIATKGDLVLVSDGASTTTCIILTSRYNMSSNKQDDFYYSYCIDDGLYGIVYSREIISIVSEKFAPEFQFESELFETDYTFYADLYERFSYYPKIFPPNDDDSDED